MCKLIVILDEYVVTWFSKLRMCGDAWSFNFKRLQEVEEKSKEKNCIKISSASGPAVVRPVLT